MKRPAAITKGQTRNGGRKQNKVKAETLKPLKKKPAALPIKPSDADHEDKEEDRVMRTKRRICPSYIPKEMNAHQKTEPLGTSAPKYDCSRV